MQLQQQRKWDVLSEMVAPKLLEKLQEDYKEHDERPEFKELDWRWVLPDEFDAGLVDLKFWSPRRAEECVSFLWLRWAGVLIQRAMGRGV